MSRAIVVLLLWLLSVTSAPSQEWQRLGPEGGLVVSLGAGAGETVYLGTADGHVFARSEWAGAGEGSKWELRGRVGNRTDAVISRMVSAPPKGERIYASVWFQEAGAGGGVFGSDDGGRTWRLLGLPAEAVRALEIAPTDENLLIAGTRSGVFRSSDAGKNWERISPAGDEELRNVDSVAIDPADGRVIYAGTYHLPWKTTDGGKNWKPVTAGLIDDSDIMSMRVDATNPARLYLSACSGIYRSEDRGGMWTKLQGIPYAARRTHSIVQDGKDPQTLYAGTTEGLWVTRDGGESWKRTTPKEWVINTVAVVAGKVVLGTDAQGILVSEDSGETFAAANEGFTHTVVRQLIGDAGDPSHLLIILQRNGTEILESMQAGKDWVELSGKKEKTAAANAFENDGVRRIYSSSWGWVAQAAGGQLWRWETGEQDWKEWKLSLSETVRSVAPEKSRKQFTTRVTVVKTSEGGLAFSDSALYASTQKGVVRCVATGSCERTKAFGSTTGSRGVWSSRAEGRLGVIADGKLGLSTDAGRTALWKDLPVANELALWLDLNGPAKEVLLGTAEGAYISRDQGDHWTRLQGGLPAGRMECWARFGNRWIATVAGGGLYISENQGVSWTREDQDGERGKFTGIAETRESIVVGSQSEGVLRLKWNTIE